MKVKLHSPLCRSASRFALSEDLGVEPSHVTLGILVKAGESAGMSSHGIYSTFRRCIYAPSPCRHTVRFAISRRHRVRAEKAPGLRRLGRFAGPQHGEFIPGVAGSSELATRSSLAAGMVNLFFRLCSCGMRWSSSGTSECQDPTCTRCSSLLARGTNRNETLLTMQRLMQQSLIKPQTS